MKNQRKRLWLFGYLICNSLLIHAQLCNNNLGDPIVNVTFGTSGTSPLPPNTTTYSFAYGCPSKGEYTINDFLFGCGGSWVQIIGDHTPDDVDGNYMLINAESTPGVVNLDTAHNLCDNMTYQFSAYIANVMQDVLTCGGKAVLPNLTFTVQKLDGTMLASYNTGDVPITNDKIWKQYGLSFKMPAGVSDVILMITANAPPGCGNAFVIDDIVFSNCGPAVSVTVNGTTADQDVCADYTNTFIMKGAYSAGFGDPVVQWQNSLDTGRTWNDIAGETTTTYVVPPITSGLIQYRMVVAERANINSANCRMRSNAISIDVHPLPPHKPPEDLEACTGTDYFLPAPDPNALDVKWTGPNGYTSTLKQSVIPTFQFSDTGLYKFRQNFFYGCFSLDSFFITAAKGIAISAGPPEPICEGQAQKLLVTASDIGTFKWTPSTGLSNDAIPDPVASPRDSITYKVIVTNLNGCKDSASLFVPVYKVPIAQAGPDKIIVSGDSTTLDGFVKGTGCSFYWSPPSSIDNIYTTQPRVYPLQDIKYTLNVTSSVGCGQASDEVEVKVYMDVFIPNSFTPNGDGKNDRFRVLPYENYKLLKFLVYNRWGAVVYNSKDLYHGWDGNINGQPQQTGTYIYYLELQNKDGKKVVKQGQLVLLR